jgi:hypothetical protein
MLKIMSMLLSGGQAKSLWGLVVCQAPGKLGLTSAKPRCLLGLVMYQGRHLDLTVSQFQGNVGLSNMLDPRHLNLIFRQVQNR